MSGGEYNYKNNGLSMEMFKGMLATYYGFGESKEARKVNPLLDEDLSELLWDMLCVVYANDYFISGDMGEDKYREVLDKFKEKWDLTKKR